MKLFYVKNNIELEFNVKTKKMIVKGEDLRRVFPIKNWESLFRLKYNLMNEWKNEGLKLSISDIEFFDNILIKLND